MDYLLSREGYDAHESVMMRVARSVVVVDISLIYYISGFPDTTKLLRNHDVLDCTLNC